MPAVAAALTLAEGAWNVGRMVNAEELDPDPFLRNLARLGIGWKLRDDDVKLMPAYAGAGRRASSATA